MSPRWRVRFLFTFAIAGIISAAAPIWLDVPFIAQEKDGCGSAALAMVIRYWGKDADAASIQRELYSPAENGVPSSAMKRYLEDHGFQVHVFRGEWQDLLHHLSLGRPLIVCFKPSRGGALHYAVAAGGDDGVLALNDPADRKLRKWERAQFEKGWRATAGWTLLAIPRAEP